MELKLFVKFLKPAFRGFTNLQREWSDRVVNFTNESLDTLTREIREEYNTRWQLLESFGKVTIRRLRRFRTFLGNKNMRKRDITEGMLSSFISNLGPAYIFHIRNDLKKMLGEKYKDHCTRLLKRSENISIEELERDILTFISNFLTVPLPKEREKVETYLMALTSKQDRIEESRLFNTYGVLGDFNYDADKDSWGFIGSREIVRDSEGRLSFKSNPPKNNTIEIRQYVEGTNKNHNLDKN
jgi:hypothetical protein